MRGGLANVFGCLPAAGRRKIMEGCQAGCKHFSGGEIKHHKDCKYYPESFLKMYDDLKRKYESKSATSAGYSADQKWEQCSDCAYNFNNFDDKGTVEIGWCYMFDDYIPNCKKKTLGL